VLEHDGAAGPADDIAEEEEAHEGLSRLLLRSDAYQASSD
jgi:hypothetical protein